MDWQAAWLTVKLAAATTAILLLIGVPLAYWLAMTKWRWRFAIEALVALPIILPPTVLGFYLLMATGPRTSLGAVYENITGSTLPFTFGGILLGSVLFNLPFAVRPFVVGFAGVNRRLMEASWCLGVSKLETFFRVTIPLARVGLLTGLVLSFAHTVGEFGVVLMIGGNIPGVTRTLSIAIYDDVQALRYDSAAQTALLLTIFAYVVMCVTYALNRKGSPV